MHDIDNVWMYLTFAAAIAFYFVQMSMAERARRLSKKEKAAIRRHSQDYL